MTLEDWLHPLAQWRTTVREEAEDPSDLDEIMAYEARIEAKLRWLEPAVDAHHRNGPRRLRGRSPGARP